MAVYDKDGNRIDSQTVPTVFVSDESLNSYDKICKSVNHRGWHSGGIAENSLAAYKASKVNGFYYVETDVQYTSDGYAILIHDSYITYQGTNTYVGNMTYEQVLEVIPTLALFEDMIALCRKIGLHPYIDMKTNQTQAQINALVDTVHKYQMGRKVTWIGAERTISKVKAYDANARIGLLATPITSADITTIKSLKTSTNEVFLDTWTDQLTSEILTMVKEANVPLEVYSFGSNTSEITGMDLYITGFTSNTLIAGKVLYEANAS